MSNTSWPAQLSNVPWFHGKCDRDHAEALLKDDGDFLVREASSGKPVVSVMHKGEPKHVLITIINNKFIISDTPDPDKAFESIQLLIDKYRADTTSKNPLPLRRAINKDDSNCAAGETEGVSEDQDATSDRTQDSETHDDVVEGEEKDAVEPESQYLFKAKEPAVPQSKWILPAAASKSEKIMDKDEKPKKTKSKEKEPAKKEEKKKPTSTTSKSSTAPAAAAAPAKPTAKVESQKTKVVPPSVTRAPSEARKTASVASSSRPSFVSPTVSTTTTTTATGSQAKNVYKYQRRRPVNTRRTRTEYVALESLGMRPKTSTVAKVERKVEDQEWYHGLLPRDHITLMLKNQGDFMVRDTDVAGQRRYVISINWDKQHNHVVICPSDGGYRINPMSTNAKELFSNIPDMIDHYYQRQEPLPQKGYILMNPIPRQAWELSHDHVKLDKKLGNGAFGEVFSGTLNLPNRQNVPVAVKRSHAAQVLSKEQIKEMIAESRLMMRLAHPNIVKFYGVAAQQQPVMIVMELVDGGGLDSYLHKNGKQVKTKERLGYCLGAAAGCGYLHSQSYLHRDIACRNILITSKGDVKVSDFGLATEGTAGTVAGHAKVPIRWLAPETLKQFVYTKKTDVWSYGVLGWEIFNDANEPYTGMTPGEVGRKVKDGYTMDLGLSKPMPAKMKTLIQNCWKQNPDQRPTFDQMVKDLKEMVKDEK